MTSVVSTVAPSGGNLFSPDTPDTPDGTTYNLEQRLLVLEG